VSSALGHPSLNHYCALHGIDRAVERGEKAVAGGLEDSASSL